MKGKVNDPEKIGPYEMEPIDYDAPGTQVRDTVTKKKRVVMV